MKTQETKTESPFTRAQIEELRLKTREVLTPKEFAHLTPYYQKKKLEEYKTMQRRAPIDFLYLNLLPDHAFLARQKDSIRRQ